MQSILRDYLSQGYGTKDHVITLSNKYKTLLQNYFQIPQHYKNIQSTFVCQKKLLWDSDIKDNVKECYVVTNQIADQTNSGLAIWSTKQIRCYLCQFEGGDLETLCLHYCMQHIKYKIGYIIKQINALNQIVPELVIFVEEEADQDQQLNKVKLINQIWQEGYNESMLRKILHCLYQIDVESPMVEKIYQAINKIGQMQSKKQIGDLEKLQNLQLKYIQGKNMNVIFHDAETGLPIEVKFLYQIMNIERALIGVIE
ncbi:UNKNOWN [Stylonychia lemnae]|uniref:Uncharacterized protein n=1 Tax=Stylonychia lemnae TaxID=5949 RepID=A0A078ATL4_STYLE|nr:UNKNOWN [Stylonychia lemnae]|eukprot:CDW85579.1 UNKNOWN [Stylonychia lemnae]